MKSILPSVYLFLIVIVAGCATSESKVPIDNDEVITRKIVGKWKKEFVSPEVSYSEIIIFQSNGRGERTGELKKHFGDLDVAIGTYGNNYFQWVIKDGFILYTDRQVQDLNPKSPTYFQIRERSDEREFVTKLTKNTLTTLDENKKTVSYVQDK